MEKKNISIFDLLKQGTSFKNKPEKHLFEPGKAPHAQKKQHKKSKSLQAQQNSNKYDTKDSESESEEIDFLNHGDFNENAKRNDEEEKEEFDPVTKAKNQRKDRIYKLLKKHKIKFEGEDVPYPVSNFTKMHKRYDLDDALVQNMKKSGYETPTPVQMQAIPILMSNRSLMSIAPTGSGKTMAYMLPLYCHLREHQKGNCRAVIFVPTVELGDQVLKEFLFFNLNVKNFLRVKFIHKMNSDAKSFQEQMEHTDVIITTPMKFIKLFQDMNEAIMAIRYAIFDEADKYFELGFLDQITTILEFLKENTSIVYGWFSATINVVIEDILKNFLKEPIKIIIGGRNNVLASIEQKLVYAGSEFGKLIEIRRMIHEGGIHPPVLIFVQSKERATELYDELKTENVKLDVIHANKSKHEREKIILKFRLGEIWILITTELMARGIDFKGVNLVINYDFPTTVISYIHRVGRTGRANRQGKAITFFTDLDKPLLRTLGNTLKASGLDVREWILKIKKSGKEVRRQLEQMPVQREPISTAVEKQADPKFKQEIKKVDKMWHKMVKKRKINTENANGQNEWVTVDQGGDDEWHEVGGDDEYEDME